MTPRASSRLLRLGETLPAAGTGDWTLQRVRGSWIRLVGPSLASRILPLAVRRNVLVLGCPDPAYLTSLRQSADATWPELQARIQRFTGWRPAAVQVEPCDPPAPEPAPAPSPDPLAEVLRRYRRKDPLDSRRQ